MEFTVLQLFTGLGDRLQHDLTSKFERDHDVRNQVISSNLRIVPNSNYREKGYSSQRKHAAWIGASLLSSFDTYHKTIKITRQEWEESPDTILSAKCI